MRRTDVSTVAGRLNFRIPPGAEGRLRSAAEANHQTLTDFVLGAAEARAEEILASRTLVASDYFDRLVDAMDAPPTSIPELAKAAGQDRRFKQR
jgi:uncharacterized protein (DUF1778 family)/predicted N-acetyltransferase YhbS